MIQNQTRNTIVASQQIITKNPWQRMKGLLGVTEFPQGQSLVITHCQSIHMLFMKIPLDVIFCDREDRVVGLCLGIKPFSFSPIFLKASYAIEVPTGSIVASQTQVGDFIKF